MRGALKTIRGGKLIDLVRNDVLGTGRAKHEIVEVYQIKHGIVGEADA